MKLIWNWRAVLLRAWSVRLALLAAVFDGISGVWFILADAVPHGAFFAIGSLLPVAAVVARIIEQPSVLK